MDLKQKEKNNQLEEILNSRSKFKSVYKNWVKFDEVDSFAVVHNLRYFYWLEWARTDYLNKLGLKLDSKFFIFDYPFMVVHSEIDYYMPCRMYQHYEVLTRVAYIKKSSLGFENLIIVNDNLSVKAQAVMVHLNENKQDPEPIPGNLKQLIAEYEEENCIFY